jgi:hypothetical protein
MIVRASAIQNPVLVLLMRHQSILCSGSLNVWWWTQAFQLILNGGRDANIGGEQVEKALRSTESCALLGSRRSGGIPLLLLKKL